VLSNNQIAESNANAPSIFAPILIPIVSIALGSIAKYPSFPFGQGALFEILVFLGHPLVALFIGILFSLRLVNKKINRSTRLDWVTDSLKEAGIIILITGAGGAFGNILKSSNLGEILGSQLSEVHVGIFLPFILAAILKIAQGSSTVAIITTATIISPLMGSLGLESELSRTFTVLAIGAGAMTVSHINDSYFWVVSQFSGMDTKTTLKSHTLATFFQGITAIALVFVLQIIFN
ncbi:MAG TPA: Na+/H+ antiporter NhaC family protein, partial [Arenibacter sp.]|nr:Na+/H+ antiporter NhaC family protein [Arenibacter sp.]